MNYVKDLDFFEAPDYNHLRSMFVDLLHSISVSEYDFDFEWNRILENKQIEQQPKEQLEQQPQPQNEPYQELQQEQISSKEIVRLGQTKEKVVRTISTTRLKDAEIK